MNEVNPNEIRAIHVRDQTLAGLQESFTYYSKTPGFDRTELTTDELDLCGRLDNQFRTDSISYCLDIEKYPQDAWIWLDWLEEFIYCALCAKEVSAEAAPTICSICRKSDLSLEWEGFLVHPDVRIFKAEQVAIRPTLAVAYYVCQPCRDKAVTIQQRAEELSQDE